VSALDYELAFHLRECRKHSCEQFPDRRRCVDALGQRTESNAAIVERPEQFENIER
jgi:hypothetical protein